MVVLYETEEEAEEEKEDEEGTEEEEGAREEGTGEEEEEVKGYFLNIQTQFNLRNKPWLNLEDHLESALPARIIGTVAKP